MVVPHPDERQAADANLSHPQARDCKTDFRTIMLGSPTIFGTEHFHHERSYLPEDRDRRLLPTSIEDAIQGAVTRAAKMHSNMNWFEVVETRGHISNGKVAHYQVVLKVGFRLED